MTLLHAASVETIRVRRTTRSTAVPCRYCDHQAESRHDLQDHLVLDCTERPTWNA